MSVKGKDLEQNIHAIWVDGLYFSMQNIKFGLFCSQWDKGQMENSVLKNFTDDC